jgi:hypothetical protein
MFLTAVPLCKAVQPQVGLVEGMHGCGKYRLAVQQITQSDGCSCCLLGSAAPPKQKVCQCVRMLQWEPHECRAWQATQPISSWPACLLWHANVAGGAVTLAFRWALFEVHHTYVRARS